MSQTRWRLLKDVEVEDPDTGDLHRYPFVLEGERGQGDDKIQGHIPMGANTRGLIREAMQQLERELNRVRT